MVLGFLCGGIGFGRILPITKNIQVGVMEVFSGTLGVVVFVFLIVLAILWFLLPFAIFGTKDKLSELIELQKETLQTLKETQAVSQQTGDGNVDLNVKTITNAPNRMVSAEEYASLKGIELYKIIRDVRNGDLSGRLVDGKWFVNVNE